MCIKHRVCLITWQHGADIHHADAVGRINRNLVDHTALKRMPLNRVMHNIAHNMGQKSFEQKYNVWGIYSNWWADIPDGIEG